MTEIPEDVMKLAQAAQDAAMAECKAEKFAVYEYPFGTGRAKDVLDAAIARAILAEREAQRERDAKIAENLANAEHRLEADENIRAHHVRGVYAGNFLSWAHGLKADAAANVAAAIRTPA